MFDDTLDRRSALKVGLALTGGIAAAALVGCGGDDEEDQGEPQPVATGAASTKPEGDGRFPYNLPASTAQPKRGGTFVQGVSWNVGPLDPAKSAAGGTIAPARGAYNGVVRFVTGAKAKPRQVDLEPDLGESWEVSPDGLTYTFKLMKGVKWQNVVPVSGRPFTAEDVKFAWERYAASGAQKGYWTALDRITTNGDATVVVRLKRPSPDFLIPIASRYLTIHPRELVDAGTIDKQAIGTGPMLLKEATASDKAVLERNPDYFRGPVPIERIEHRVMVDAQARVNAFRVGQLDHAQTAFSNLRDVDALLKTNPDVQVTVQEPLYAPFQYTFNLENPKWQDVRVRRAIQMGIDREAIVQVVLEGAGANLTAIPWLYLFNELPTGADKLGQWWAYEPDQAKQLLQAAGVENLSFDCIWYGYSETGNARPNAQVVDQLRKIGVTMRAQQTEYTQFNSQWTGVTYSDVADGWSSNGFTGDTFFLEQLHSTSPNNRSRGLKDPQIDAWAEQQSSELNASARREIWRKIWDRVQDQVWRVDKPSGKGYEVLQPWVRNMSFTGPLNANYSFTEVTAPSQLEKAWLDK